MTISIPSDVHAKLKQIYSDPNSPGGLGGAKRLHDAAKKANVRASLKIVKQFLTSIPTYGIMKQQRVRFQRRAVESLGINWLWELDLAEMPNLWRDNQGVRYLLCQIDVFSKVAHAIPIKDKKATSIVQALKQIFRVAGHPLNISSDFGSEFIAEETQELMVQRGINAYFMRNPETGAPNVERYIRTLKGRIYRYMRQNNTKKYVDRLPEIVEAINNSYHRGIGMVPSEVRPKHSSMLRRRFLERVRKLNKPRRPFFAYMIGQLVRIKLTRGTFHVGYRAQHTVQIFKIKRRLITTPPTYELETVKRQPITGTFYEAELVPVTLPPPPLPPLRRKTTALPDVPKPVREEPAKTVGRPKLMRAAKQKHRYFKP